jgi:hypothetical protein
VYTGKEKEKEK